jgi:hypothetical protein
MEIQIIPDARLLRVAHKGQHIDWKYGVWAKLPREETEAQFGPTNDFLAWLPMDMQDKMFDLYSQAHEAVSEFKTKNDTREAFFTFAPLIVNDITNELLQEWIATKPSDYIWVEPTPPVRSSKNPPAMTYTEEESRQLSIFCVVAKILAPIIGRYVEEVREKGGQNKAAAMHKERQASRLFLATKLVTFPAYQRLELYLEAFAARKQNTVPLAVRYGTATADLNSFLIGLTIVRRLMISTVRTNGNGSIVAFIYKFLEEKINELSNNREYRPKISNRDSDNGEEESYSDQFRIPEDVDQGMIETTNAYLSEYDATGKSHLATYLNLTDAEWETALYLANQRVNDPNFYITDQIHYPIIGMLARHLIFHRMLDKVDLQPLVLMATVSSVYCRRQGWEDIADLLIAYRKEVDINVTAMTAKNGVSYKRLPDHLVQELSDLYPYVPQVQARNKTNPGKMFIETVINQILAYEWIGLNDPSNIRTSLAEFIINRPGNK